MLHVRFVYRSFVRLIKLTNETNEPITRTKCKRTENERPIHANETNAKRKRYEISVNLNDPGSVNKGNNKITELRTILQRESQNS